jgi:hypothetical protein
LESNELSLHQTQGGSYVTGTRGFAADLLDV